MTRNEALQVFNVRSAKFSNTQSIQWKMNISIWTLFVLAIFYDDKIIIPNLPCEHLVAKALIGLVFIIIHVFFCETLQHSLECDKAVNDHIVDQMNNGIEERLPIHVDLGMQPKTKKGGKWIAIQVSVSIVLYIIFLLS